MYRFFLFASCANLNICTHRNNIFDLIFISFQIISSAEFHVYLGKDINKVRKGNWVSRYINLMFNFDQQAKV